MSKHVAVSLGSAALLEQQHISEAVSFGNLYFDQIRKTEVSSFAYADTWLKSASSWYIDPDISFFAGRQYPPSGKTIFGFISDSCPDRWGRTLLQRSEVRKAALEQKTPRQLTESDYLLGVNDTLRVGALRFSCEKDPEENPIFLADGKEGSVPPWLRLRALEHAAFSLESREATPEQLDANLSLLLDPGSSLGGARPKACVEDEKGNLWIAKFPSKHDNYDSGLTEYLVYALAKDFEISVSEVAVDALSNRGHTFLIKRFDRDGSLRIHFSSAMNLLGKLDGDNAASDVSYLDILSLLREHGATPIEDSLELYKRILFSIAVSNTDDHLRNHGFLLSRSGWKLSPLYDVNPNPFGRGLSLNISEHDNSLSFELAIAQASFFGLSKNKARMLVDELTSLVPTWEKRAKKLGMDRATIDFISPAFRCCI